MYICTITVQHKISELLLDNLFQFIRKLKKVMNISTSNQFHVDFNNANYSSIYS